ncbi:MAG: dTDP-4-dehydrorhamnose reductase [Planctomycetota bacterium]|nr:dTDP-4-dehydrorhamnose reductase [Planctomycetota bacterium]
MSDAASWNGGGVLVVGAGGMLGRAIRETLARRETAFRAGDLDRCDITDARSVEAFIGPGVGVVINCAAYTEVDKAEVELEKARLVNAAGVANLAARCKQVGATLVHYSTDYVFRGEASSPYPTDTRREPLNAYGVSKGEGEAALEASGCDYLCLRTSWLYAPWGKNFVRTITKFASEKPVLRVVDDQRGRPTSAEHLAELTLRMLDARARGMHHATDAGECTWFEFAEAIVAGARADAERRGDARAWARVEPCTSAEFPRPAKRPAYSVLDLSKTEGLIGPITHWRDTLASVMPRLERPL